MTVIIQAVKDIAGAADNRPIFFRAQRIHVGTDGNTLVTTQQHRFIPVAGVLTTSNLDPGFCDVVINGRIHPIEIPASDTPIRLTPLLEVGAAPDPGPGCVVDGGGIARVQAIVASAYAALIASTTPDPGSTFFVYPDPPDATVTVPAATATAMAKAPTHTP